MAEVEVKTTRPAKYTKVVTVDEPHEQNKANHEYVVRPINPPADQVSWVNPISFQNGPIKENGVNGLHNEDLISIVVHRLQGFQSSEFKCRENAIAITKLEEALLWLNYRTSQREERGVEGLNIV